MLGHVYVIKDHYVWQSARSYIILAFRSVPCGPVGSGGIVMTSGSTMLFNLDVGSLSQFVPPEISVVGLLQCTTCHEPDLTA